MLFDASLPSIPLSSIPSYARAAEELGFDAIWSSETTHDPFLPGALIAEHTHRLHFGTAVAIAFARSPATIAYTAWDLAQASGGRFLLGLGTQVKAHIERRFGMVWEPPAPKLREMILAIRAVWNAWQGDGTVNFRGQFYKITLMTPFFNPGPIDHPQIPIYIAGVNEHLCHVAGELCQGFHVHPFHTARYIREIVLPNVERGLRQAGRPREDIQLSSAIFVATDEAEREAARAQVSFYASTPTYRTVLEVHGWGDVAERLSHLAARKQWDEMPTLITDEILNEAAIIAPAEEAPARIKERYTGLLDRVTLYAPFTLQEVDKWRALVKAFKGAAQ
jgi:probable F420-dependent oxidoreductase